MRTRVLIPAVQMSATTILHCDIMSLKSIQFKIEQLAKCHMLGTLTANCHDWEVIQN